MQSRLMPLEDHFDADAAVRFRRSSERRGAFYQRDRLQACTVCGRLFCRRKDNVCSMACAEKAAPSVASESRS